MAGLASAATAYFGDRILSSFLGVIFDKLISFHFDDFFRGSKIHKALLSKLKVKLLSIDALADDAEQKQFTDPRVRDWLLEAKDVVFEAEDLLGEIDYQLTKCQVEPVSQSTTNKVMNFLKPSSMKSFEKEIQSRMEQMLDNIEDLLSLRDYLGFRKDSGVGVGSGGSSTYVSWKLASTSLPSEESFIYGRDDDKENIINQLTSNPHDNNLSILSIIGMGGLGKTTLAQLVYNDSRIEGMFDIKAWVCVSNDFDFFKVTRTILEAFTKSNDDSRDLEMVHGRLKKELTGKKFLLVLDDVWNQERDKWEVVQKPLAFGAHGSRILVTTRNKEVASTMRSKELQLQLLQEDHCQKLFSKYAFPNDSLQQISDYKEVGMKIVGKCKGLPLALKSMGSLLHNKSSVSEWEDVLESDIWQLKDNNIVPALALSYCHLPSHLKRCFAYCALFPKDYLFDKENLIQLWMAGNFLQCQQQGKSLEKVGQQIFSDLLSRSFFQQSSIIHDHFVMHDLLNDLAKYVCGDICFRLEVDQVKGTPKTTRHFSFSVNLNKDFDGFGSLHNDQRLRTFMPLERQLDLSFGDFQKSTTILIQNLFSRKLWRCKIPIDDLFSKFKFLRVLSFSDCINLREVPKSLGNLIHLCSLDLSDTLIEKLPESICSLYNLQILKLNSCTQLKELPSNLHKLTNLHCLEIKYTEIRKMPEHLGQLKNLQVWMSSLHVGKSREFGIQQLGELNLHGSLSIMELQNIENPSDALRANLINKTHLVELELQWNTSSGDPTNVARDVIEHLQPSKQLVDLFISNYGGTNFPTWLFNNSLLNMVYLELHECQFCQRLPPLGQLPFLKNLEISNLDGIVDIDVDFCGGNLSSFTSLETLKFSHMYEWKKWECQTVTSAFPRLQHLSLVTCPKLKENLPELLPHLRCLYIHSCKQLEASVPSTPEIVELHLVDFGKLQFHYHPTSLEKLIIMGDNIEASLQEKIGHIISDNNSLTHVHVKSCPNMNILITSHFYSLFNLVINDGCDSITTFSLDFFPTLMLLSLDKCRNLQLISQEHTQSYLKQLKISECPQLESLSDGMHMLLPSLDKLYIIDCPKVELFPDGGLPSKLKRMYLNNCSKLVASLKGAFRDNPSLEVLHVGGLEAECFPDQGLLPLSLTSLRISDCPNLKRLDYEGLTLNHLSSLKLLILQDCPKLELLEEGLPKSFSNLIIVGCPLIGEDWGNIAHFENCDAHSLSLIFDIL